VTQAARSSPKRSPRGRGVARAKSMSFPRPSPPAVKLFHELIPQEEGVRATQMFGQPVAFVNGTMFFGVFGESVFVRLSEGDRVAARRIPGFAPFEPMPGRTMQEYAVLPRSILERPDRARQWVARSLRYASGLPVKRAKSRVR